MCFYFYDRNRCCFLGHHFQKLQTRWWSLPFRFVAKMATVEGEKCLHYPGTYSALPFAILLSVNALTN